MSMRFKGPSATDFDPRKQGNIRDNSYDNYTDGELLSCYQKIDKIPEPHKLDSSHCVCMYVSMSQNYNSRLFWCFFTSSYEFIFKQLLSHIRCFMSFTVGPSRSGFTATHSVPNVNGQ